ncbi:nucleotidyltransferase [Striga asiatica]|uniref:Nucleotidyltransferase n=1 Tax=Striga asiatica TaxID=4170 RepID=A0A5A7P0X7_STRAF|nr:nucleotidyltransferase [Striga asiatica]
MNSRQQLLDSLTAHISLYHSQTPDRFPNSNPNPRPYVLRWFSSLSVHQRRAHMTAIDPSFIAILLQMKGKLRSNGAGRFIILPDLPQNDDSSMPTLCYRKSDGLVSRFAEFSCAQRAIHDSVELFSSTEGERDVKGDAKGFPCLDAMCVAEGLVSNVNQFVEVMDEITNGEFLRGGDEGEMAGDWVELGWLKAKGYYSLEEFVVNRIEVSLRLSWLGSNSGKKRGVKLKDKVSAAGVAANVFWRKKGCVDWWEKLDGCVKKKVYSAFLGKAAGKLTDDIVKGNLPFLDDEMWGLDDQEKLLQRRDSSFVWTRNIATCRRTNPKTKSNDKHVTDLQKLSPLYIIFNSLYILQIICNMLSAAQCGEYDKLFFSPLNSVNSISDVMLRKFRDFLMVISLDCTKIELLGEGTKTLTKKLNNKPVTPSRKKKGKNQNKKSNPVPRSCQDDPKRANPTKGKGDEVLCTSNVVDRHPSKFDCEVPKKDLVREGLSSADAMESVNGVNNGKFRGAPRKSRKERKKYKSSGPNGSEVSSCEPRCTRVSPASVSSQPGPPMPDLAMGSSTFKNVTSNGGIQIDRLDANSMLCSKLTDDNPDNVYSTETGSHLCVKHHPDISDAVLSGSETTRHNSSKCDPDSSAKTRDPAVEYNDEICTRVVSGGNPATGYLGKLSRGGEEVKPPLVQENANLGVLRVGTMSSPAYVSYEWPNVAPFHPLTNAHHPATTDRLHLDVGHTLQNNFHHSFVHTVQVRKSPIDNNGYNGILSRPLPMSLDWPPVVRGVNRIVPSVTSSYDTEFISRRQSRFQQGITGQNLHCGADSEDERTISSDLIDFPDVPIPQELVEEHDKNWMSEEELETHAVSGMDYNQYFGGGVMYWNPSDHPVTSFSRPPSLCSDDSSWAWREADMNRAVDDMVAFSSSYSTNGLTSPSTASFCSPFDPLGPGAIGYVMPGGEISNKVLHSSSTMNDGGAEESVSGSMSNISGDGEMKTVDSHPYPILRPIIIPSMSRDRSRSEFKRNYDHKSPCVPPNRREHPRIKRPPSPVVLCVPHAPHPPPPSPVGDSRKQRGFPTVRSGSSSPRHWGVKGWFHDGFSFEEACVPMEGSDIVWPSWRNKALSARQLPQPLAGPFLQDRLMAISQLARDQEHPDVILPLEPPDTQNCSTRKASLSLIHDVLHDEIDLFCKQVAAENLIRKPYINWAVKRVARSLQVLWPRARTNIYGSNATGLSLPSSDVDLVVCLPPVRNLEPIKEAGILEGRNGIKETCLQDSLMANVMLLNLHVASFLFPSKHAARYLANQEWVKSDSLKIVENTAIPIIMLVAEVPHNLILTQSNVQTSNQEAEQLSSTGGDHFQPDTTSSEGNASPEWSKTMNDINDGFKSVRIDISFKSPTHSGLQTTGLVKDLTERFPAVMPLTLVLKQFLADRSLDQSYSGGLSSYCLILLITRFLQHEHHHGRPTNQSYGSLLMDFLYFFGNVFEPRQMRVSVQGSGVYLKRERGCSIDPLYIDDPLFLTNNVGRNCFRIHQCIKAFADAYAMLENELTCIHNDDDSNAKPNCELLPKLIPSIAHFVGS